MLIKKTSGILSAILLILTTCKPLLAQDSGLKKEKDFIIKGGITLNRINARDEIFSSIPYSGWTPGFLLSLMIRNQTALQELTVNYNNGKLSMPGFSEQTLQQLFLNVDYSRLYKISRNETASFQSMIGGNLDVLYAKRDYKAFVNRNSSFEFAASLGASFEAAYTFQNGILSGFIIIDRINIPVISLLDQPTFGSEQPAENLNGEGYSVKSFFKSSRVASFSSYMRIKNLLVLQKNITDRQSLSFQYSWDYYQVPGNRNVKQAIHSAGIAYQIIL